MKKLIFAVLMLAFSVPVEATTVCTVGNSITAHGDQLRATMLNYHPSWVYVGSRGVAPYRHDGVAGDSTIDVINRLGQVPYCDFALVLIGTNDFHNGIFNQDTTARNIETIAAALSARGTRVWVLKVLKRWDDLNLNTWNKGINAYIDLRVTSATVLDTWNALPTGWELIALMPDGLHPNNAGYDVLAHYIGPRIP